MNRVGEKFSPKKKEKGREKNFPPPHAPGVHVHKKVKHILMFGFFCADLCRGNKLL